jgi:hypothetical protein
MDRVVLGIVTNHDVQIDAHGIPVWMGDTPWRRGRISLAIFTHLVTGSISRSHQITVNKMLLQTIQFIYTPGLHVHHSHPSHVLDLFTSQPAIPNQMTMNTELHRKSSNQTSKEGLAAVKDMLRWVLRRMLPRKLRM